MTQELIQTPRGNNLNILSLTKTETSPLSTSTAVTTAQHLLHASFYFQNRNTKTQCTFSAALNRQLYLQPLKECVLQSFIIQSLSVIIGYCEKIIHSFILSSVHSGMVNLRATVTCISHERSITELLESLFTSKLLYSHHPQAESRSLSVFHVILTVEIKEGL